MPQLATAHVSANLLGSGVPSCKEQVASRPMARFEKGKSGNPAGRRAGAGNRTTQVARARIECEADPLAFLTQVMRGEPIPLMPVPGDEITDAPPPSIPTLAERIAAARVLAGKLVPDAKDRAIRFDLGSVATPADALRGMGEVVSAMSRGELTPSEAGSIISVIESFTKSWEASELESRLAAVEAAQENRR